MIMHDLCAIHTIINEKTSRLYNFTSVIQDIHAAHDIARSKPLSSKKKEKL